MPTYFASYAETVGEHLYTTPARLGYSRLADDRDNFRAALAWSVDRDEASVGFRILAALWLWWWTSYSEGLAWADRVLSLPSAAESDLDPRRRTLHGRDLRLR